MSRRDGTEVTYDPTRLHGVTLYRDAERAFSVGDRLQFTLASRALRVANRELGTLERFERSGEFTVRLDSGRRVSFLPQNHPHIDHGYAVTSHSGQGQTADRVLVHVDTTLSPELVNRRLAYVAISRGRFDAQVFTDNRSQLERTLSRDVHHESALSPSEAKSRQELSTGTTSAPTHRTTHGISRAL